MTVSADGLVEWLTGRGIEEPLHTVSAPDYPPRVGTVVPTGGLRGTTEGAFERPTFRLVARGSSEADAAALARSLDSAVMDAERPLEVGGVFCIDAGRTGGPPGVSGETDAGWVQYACQYYFEADSGR